MAWKSRSHRVERADLVFMLALLAMFALIGYGAIQFFRGP
jgi:hypothetical protein